jgi:hypothetical protein
MTALWIWLAASAGFLMGWLAAVALVQPDRPEEVDELERIFRL